MTKRIPLPRGKFALVDDEDYARLGQYAWSQYPHGARRFTGGRAVLMHRLIANAPAEMDVSHINGDVLDNRRCNLLVCDRSTSMANKRLARLKAAAEPAHACPTCGQPWRFAPVAADPEELEGPSEEGGEGGPNPDADPALAWARQWADDCAGAHQLGAGVAWWERPYLFDIDAAGARADHLVPMLLSWRAAQMSKVPQAATQLLNAAADVPLATIPPALHAPLLVLENTVLREQLEGRDAEVAALRACVAELQGQVNTARLDAIEQLEAQVGRLQNALTSANEDKHLALDRFTQIERAAAEKAAQLVEAAESRRLLLLRIAELESEAARREGFIVELEGRLSNALAGRPPVKAIEAPTLEACPHCGKADFTSKASRSQHVNYCPKNPGRLVPARHKAPAAPAEDDPNWRCEVCASDAHARDLHDPARCIRCAKSFGRAA